MSFLDSPGDFQFDPQLFGGYREPQQNVLSNGFDDTFFTEAISMDFTTPYFAPSPAAPPKKDLMSQIDEEKNEDHTELSGDGQVLTCNKIWYDLTDSQRICEHGTNDCHREKLQNCPKVQSGEFDLDGLCSDLQKKAKCSGSGAVVDEHTFEDVMKKYLGKDRASCAKDAAAEARPAAQLKAD